MDESWRSAVCVVAHPDDLEYGAASAVARWTGAGKKVAYVLATSGEAGIEGLPPQRCGPLREQEQRASAAVVGVDHVEFLGHRDGTLQADPALRRATLDACRDAANSWVFTELGPPWRGVDAVYVAGAGNPTHFVDVTATVEAGVASLRCHRAYIEGLGTDFDPERFVGDVTGFGGMAAGCDNAVLFQRYGV
jgi:LmbE family N-acetylglucosaminyl deacetylase